MDRQAAVRIIRDTFEKPFNKEQYVYFIKNLFNKIDEDTFEYHGQYIKDSYKPYIKKYERIGKYNDSEDNKIDILIVNLKKGTLLERARTMQRNFIAQYLKDRGEKDAAIVAFHTDDLEDWRFSLVKMEYKLAQTKSGRIKAKEELTPARRYSFLVGENEPNHTAKQQLAPLLQDDINNPTLGHFEEAFNIEKVTKEFFEKYRVLYLQLKESVDAIAEKDKNVREEFTKKNVDTVDFSKKLLGQIVFLYFLQKKGWLGVPPDKPWGEGNRGFLRTLFNRSQNENKNVFNDFLEVLFYNTLNNPRQNEVDPSYSKFFDCRIPFLNGGLFEPINNYDWAQTDIKIPDKLFSNNEKTKEGDTGTGILNVFDRYNFTVKEDEPLEREVAIDPEMLGKVFENLLEVKDRKSKGSYYTPREIVHYMCQESLINYLSTELSPSVIARSEATKQSQLPTKEDIETLIHFGDFAIEHDIAKEDGTKTYKHKLSENIRYNAKLIDEKLENIRVCDPAIGSGAFLVGIMTEIVRARNTLTTYLSPVIANEVKQSRSIYNFKRHAIQNCLYGVDIDSSAVDIAKLRLWLSLIVDEEDIRQIKPLPNLDYKIVCGNSLLGVEKSLENWQLFDQLEKLKPLLFNETNPRKKQEYKNQIDELIKKITNNDEHFDFEVYFSEVFHEKKGFDVVIANPPYVRQEKIKDQKQALQKQGYEVYNSTSDLYTYFYERSHHILKPNGFSCFISSNKWMRAKYGEKLRRFFKGKTTLKQIIDFNGYQVFDATVDTDILLFQKTKPSENIVNILNIQPDFTPSTDITNYFNSHKLEMKQSDFDTNCFTFADKTILNLKNKIEEKGIPLKNWDVRICFGIKTGFSEAFIIDTAKRDELIEKDPKNTEIIKPILRGRDIYRYHYKWSGLWLINPHNGLKSKEIKRIDVKKYYPVIYKHLQQFQKKLEKRKDKGEHWTNLRNCAYLDEFEKEKILYQEMTNESSFSWDNNKMYVNQSCYIISNANKYILCLLNSRLINQYFKWISQTLGSGAFRWIKQYVEQIPIPKISESEQKPFIDLVDKILAIIKDDDYLTNSTKQARVKEYERQIDQMIYELYGLTEGEKRIVENFNKNN